MVMTLGRVAANPNIVTREPFFKLGTVEVDDNSDAWTYGQASAAIAANGGVSLDANFSTTTGSDFVALVAFAAGEYGWFRKAASPFK